MGEMGPVVRGDHNAGLAGAQVCAAFLFASFSVGRLVFLLGSLAMERAGKIIVTPRGPSRRISGLSETAVACPEFCRSADRIAVAQGQ